MDNELLIIILFTIIFIVIHKYTINDSKKIIKENMMNNKPVFHDMNQEFASNKTVENIENTVDPRKIEDPLDDTDTLNLVKELTQDRSEDAQPEEQLSKQERIDKQNAVFNKSSNDYIVDPDYKNVEFDDKTIGEIIDQVKLEIDAGISNEQLTTIQGEHFQQENKELEKYYNPVFTSYDKNFGINNNFTIDRSFNKKEFSEGNQTIQPYAGKTFGSLY